MRRVADIAFAVVALIALAPLLLVIAVAVRLDSPGNPFYGGVRVGQRGRRFRMWKFRSMVAGADKSGPGITARQDARVTRVGGLLRKTKLDELPQFFNLLLGDLTLIGPRAEIPRIVEQYNENQRRVLEYKPGVTGVGAIAYTESFGAAIPEAAAAEAYYISNVLDEKLGMEIEYEQRRSFSTDSRIFAHTVMLMLRGMFGQSPGAAPRGIGLEKEGGENRQGEMAVPPQWTESRKE